MIVAEILRTDYPLLPYTVYCMLAVLRPTLKLQFPSCRRPDVSEAQMRWQAFTSLDDGARGVLYFCYWSPTGTSFLWGGALMVPRSLGGGTPVYQPGPKLAQAARINAKLSTFGSFLLSAVHTGVFLANGTGNNTVPVTGANGVVTAIGGSGAGPAWSVLLGAYASPAPTWGSAVILQNQDWVYPAVFSILFAANTTAWEVNPTTGSIAAAWNDAPGLGGFELYVDAGDARLFVFPL